MLEHRDDRPRLAGFPVVRYGDGLAAVASGSHGRGAVTLGAMSEVPIWEASTHLSEVARGASQRGEVVYLVENGQRLAAIVPAEMAAQIEAAEDAEDLEAALAARDEPGEPVRAEQLWAELGL